MRHYNFLRIYFSRCLDGQSVGDPTCDWSLWLSSYAPQGDYSPSLRSLLSLFRDTFVYILLVSTKDNVTQNIEKCAAASRVVLNYRMKTH